MVKVLVTPRSFANYAGLEVAGITVIRNPAGGILSKEQMQQHIREADGVIIGVDPLDADVLRAAPRLRFVSKYGVGTDNIDLEYCKSHGIEVSITKNANSNAVADYAFALMLAAARRVSEIDASCRKGDWGKKPAVDVFGKKMGVLGLGAIGRGMVARAKGFGMAIYAYDAYRDDIYINNNNINFLPYEAVLRECDFLSLHLPLTGQTRHIINAANLRTAKKNLIIINTARGALINEADLYEALRNGTILGAGVDVFENEPAHDSKLLALSNVVAGSHAAASTPGAVENMNNQAVENIVRGLRERGLL